MKKHIYNRNIVLILAASFFYLSSPMLINPLITGFSKSLGSSTLLAGVIAGLMNIASLILRPIAGNLVDRYSKYLLSSLGGFFLIIASVGYVIVTNPAWLLIIRVVNGIGYVLCTVCMATWMANLLPRERVGSGMGIYGLMNALGMALAPALGIFLYKHFGYRYAFVASVISSILMVVLVQLVTDHGHPLKKAAGVKHSKKFRIVQPQVLPIAMILMLFALPYFSTQAYIVSYVASIHSKVAVGSFFPIYAILLLVLRMSLKDLFDSVVFGKFLYASLGSTLIGLLALTHLSNNFMMFIAALGLAGGYGLMFSICQATSLLIAPHNEQGLANSTFYIGMDLGMSLGPIIGGLIKSAIPTAWFYPVMLVTIPIIWLIYFMNRKSLNHVF